MTTGGTPLLLVENLSTVARQPFRLRRRSALGTPRRGNVLEASLVLGPQLTAVLGEVADGTTDLVEALSGRLPPGRGRILVAGASPSKNAAVRARIGYLPPEREELPGRTVGEAVAAVDALRGGAGRAFALAKTLGLDALLARRVATLSFDEHRAVELLLALATPNPALLVLFEPFQHVAAFDRPALVAHLEEIARTAVVIVVTASPDDARVATAGVLLLERGVLTRGAGPTGEGLAIASPAWFSVWVGAGARDLAKALLDRPEVRSVAAEPAMGATLLRVGADGEHDAARAIAESVAAVPCELFGLAELPPSRAAVGLTSELIAVTGRTHAVDRLRHAQEQYIYAMQAQIQAQLAQANTVQQAQMTQAHVMQQSYAAQQLAAQQAHAGHQAPMPQGHPQMLGAPGHMTHGAADDRRFAPPGYFDPPPASVAPQVAPPSAPPPAAPPPSAPPPPGPPPSKPPPGGDA